MTTVNYKTMLTTFCTAFDDGRELNVIAALDPGIFWPEGSRVLVGIEGGGQRDQTGELIEFMFGLTPDNADKVADAMKEGAALARAAMALPPERRK